MESLENLHVDSSSFIKKLITFNIFKASVGVVSVKSHGELKEMKLITFNIFKLVSVKSHGEIRKLRRKKNKINYFQYFQS